MNPLLEHQLQINRRQFFGRTSTGIGAMALGSLLNSRLFADETTPRNRIGGLTDLPHYAPKAKRVIYLFQSGGPAQMDLFDHKPQLQKHFGKEVPKSIYPDERKTTMTSAQPKFSTAPSVFSVQTTRQKVVSGSVNCCHTSHTWRTTFASCDRCTPKRSTTIPR